MSHDTMRARRILLVEDDPDLAASLREVLVADGFDVAVAPDGRAGLEALEHRQFEVVVLDLLLPGMDGIEFRLRQRQHSSQWSTPVLVVSAHYDVERLAASVGAAGWLAKPIAGDALVAAVREVLAANGSQV